MAEAKRKMTSYNRRPDRRKKAFRKRAAEGNPKGRPCYYCSRIMREAGDPSLIGATKDHVRPKSRGGEETVWACRACNNLKGNMTLREWRAWCERAPKWWELATESKRVKYGLSAVMERDDTPGRDG